MSRSHLAVLALASAVACSAPARPTTPAVSAQPTEAPALDPVADAHEKALAEVARLTDATTVATKLRVWRARREVARRAARDPILADYVGGADAP
jgi:hypothetical protein